jgi:hypothetical protein
VSVVASSRIPLTSIYEPVENGWMQARIKELPAVTTAAPSLEEAKELLLDALREYLLSLGEAGESVEVGEEARRETIELLVSV